MTRSLDALFDPTSIAVVGASADPAKWGNAVALQALRGKNRHTINLVNRRGGEVHGHPCVTSIDEVDGPVDLAVIAVPEAGFEEAVDAALAKGATAIVAITAGLGEAGAQGRAREQALIARVRAAGASLIGPNCLGVVDNTVDTYLSSNAFVRGDVALLSQSGNLAIEVDRLLSARGLGISRFVSLGNQADVGLVELIEACAADVATAAIAVYVEDFRDGRGFVEAAAAAVDAGTPVAVLAAGSSTAASRGAQSHTGSLTSDAAVIKAACQVAGAIRVETPRELADVLLALRQHASPVVRASPYSPTAGGTASSRATWRRRGACRSPRSPRLPRRCCWMSCGRSRARPTRSTWPGSASRTPTATRGPSPRCKQPTTWTRS